MQYKAISDYNLHSFNANVNIFLKEGWSLYGDLKVTLSSPGSVYYTQVLVKEGE